MTEVFTVGARCATIVPRMKKSEAIKVRMDVVMKDELVKMAQIDNCDVSDIARVALKNYLTERERRKQQPELRLYAAAG